MFEDLHTLGLLGQTKEATSDVPLEANFKCADNANEVNDNDLGSRSQTPNCVRGELIVKTNEIGV